MKDDLCPCHGVPWYVQPGGKHAGSRACYVKRLERKRKWNEENREATREHVRKYEKTEKGKAKIRRHTGWASIRTRRRRERAQALDDARYGRKTA